MPTILSRPMTTKGASVISPTIKGIKNAWGTSFSALARIAQTPNPPSDKTDADNQGAFIGKILHPPSFKHARGNSRVTLTDRK